MVERKRVAILVHNDVLKDARVRKQARTLVAQGFNVDIYGFSANGNVDYPSTIENGASLTIETRKTAKLGVRLYLNARESIKELKKVIRQHLMVYSVAVAVFAAVLGWLLSTSQFAAWLIVAALVVMAFLGASAFLVKNRVAKVKHQWGYASIAASLEKNLDGKMYDYVHCHDVIALIAGCRVKRKKPDVVLIWDAHELYTELQYKDQATRGYINSIIEHASMHVDKFVTISESFVRQYAERYPKLPKGHVVMNATRRPESNELKNGLLNSAANIETGQKILLFQGGFSLHRGIDKLLAASIDLPEDWSVVFMGYGPLEAIISEFARLHNPKRSKARPFVALLPAASHEELRDWTSGATIGVIPYENTSLNHLYCTPNKLWEYPNARVPILASDLIEMGKIIREHQIGILLPRDFSSEDIVNAIKGVTDEQLKTWKENCDAYNEVENWEKYESNLMAAYL